MTDPDTAAPAPELERPPHGGSFVRQADGSLHCVESAMPKPAPAPADSPAAPPPAGDAPATDQSADAGEQHEG